jgi:hypothetical protein
MRASFSIRVFIRRPLRLVGLSSPRRFDRHLRGDAVDWTAEFVEPLYVGIETFRACVSVVFGALQRIAFNRPDTMTDAQRMVTAVLAGYAWTPTAIVREPAHAPADEVHVVAGLHRTVTSRSSMPAAATS